MRTYEPFYWVNELSKTFLSRDYLSKGEDVFTRLHAIANHAEHLLNKPGFADKFYDNMSKGWYSLSTPVWANFGKRRGLPVSCFNSHIDDDVGSILYAQAEVGMMSKLGGGTSGYFGELRPCGAPITDNGTSTGVVHFLELFQGVTEVISQGSTRRGRMAAYLPVDHPDIMKFLRIGTENHPIQEMNIGVVVDDAWMQSMLDGDAGKREVWSAVLGMRKHTGNPYIFFRDTANNKAADVFRDKNQRINSSNLCSEIFLPSSSDESFTCILSSMNLLHYDEWKDTDAIETLTYFLDAVTTEFLDKLLDYKNSPDEDQRLVWEFMRRPYNFTARNRAIGVGALGWVSYLQSKMIGFESGEAARLNREIFQRIQEKTYKASREMAAMYGSPENLEGYGRRNATTMAIAPTTSSAFILGQVSQSIEPPFSNCYVKDLAKVKTVIKNKYLEELLESKGYNTPEVWSQIVDADGSVLGLSDSILTQEEKQVFLTFGEINQETIIDQAASRQDFIDQGQSINLMIPSTYTAKEINALHIRAWRLGLKSLYYQHGTNAAQALLRVKNQECIACSS